MKQGPHKKDGPAGPSRSPRPAATTCSSARRAPAGAFCQTAADHPAATVQDRGCGDKPGPTLPRSSPARHPPRALSTESGASLAASCRRCWRYELRRHKYYLLQVTSRRDLVLTLESPGINSTLALFTRVGAPVAERDGDWRAWADRDTTDSRHLHRTGGGRVRHAARNRGLHAAGTVTHPSRNTRRYSILAGFRRGNSNTFLRRDTEMEAAAAPAQQAVIPVP